MCLMSSNEDGIRVVQYAALIVDKLTPQVSLFSSQSDQKTFPFSKAKKNFVLHR